MKTNFTYGEILSYGWEKTKKHFWFFAGLLVIAWLAQVVPTEFANLFKNKFVVLYIIFLLGAWILQFIVRMGLIRISLDVFDKGEAKLNSLFSCSKFLVDFILGSLLYLLIVVGGFILLIVPGIIWAIKYQFFAYLIIDKNLSPTQALKKSAEITEGNKWKLFLLNLLFVLINIAGAICLMIGLFVTIPVTMMASAYVYRKLIGEIVVPEVESPAKEESPIKEEPAQIAPTNN